MVAQYGYPDYQRVQLSSGYQLYAAAGSVVHNTPLFFGYVGNFPYVNLFSDVNASADHAQIRLIYYSDSAKSITVGFRYVIRTGGNFSATQYANLGPWLYMDYQTKSGADMSWATFGLYGSTGYATQQELTSLDVPIFSFNQNIAAAGSFSTSPVHIQPGPASLMLYTTAAKWHGTMTYYDYGSDSQLQILHFDQQWGLTGGIWDVPMLDTPCTFSVTNDDTATKQFVGSWRTG